MDTFLIIVYAGSRRSPRFSSVEKVGVKHRPGLLSDYGPAYLPGELREYLGERGMARTRGAP